MVSRVHWFVALALAVAPVRIARAQVFAPVSGSTFPAGSQVAMSVAVCFTFEQYLQSWSVTFNGVATGWTSYYGWQLGGCSNYGFFSSGTATISAGDNTLATTVTAYYSDGADQYYSTTKSGAASYTGTDPLASHNGYNRSAGLCVASCWDKLVSYTTPAYSSLDQARAVTLLYSSGQLGDLHTVGVDVYDQTPQQFSLRLQRPDQSYVTFTNGSTEVFFNNDFYEYRVTRLLAQFRDTSLATGAYEYTLVLRRYINGSPTDVTYPLRLLVVNERPSPYGAGWSVAGAPRLRFGPGDSLSYVEGGGTIQFWRRTSCTGSGGTLACVFTPPPGAFDSLTYAASGSPGPYRRRLLDASQLYFSSTGTVVAADDPFGNRTRFVWKDAERLDSIVDPAGQAIVFGYDGSNRLATIRDVPGNRTTSITINSANHVTQIQDPAGGLPFQQASYDATHRLVSLVDRRGGDWHSGYDFAGKLASDSTPQVKIDTGGTQITTRLMTAHRAPTSAHLVDPALTNNGSSSAHAASPKSDSAGVGSVTPSGGVTRSVRVDVFGALLRVLAPAQEIAWYTREGNSLVTAAADSTGSWTYTYSGPRLASATNTVTSLTTTYDWNTTYNVITHRYGGGSIDLRNFVGTNGRIDSTRVGNQAATRFAYDSRGRVTSVTDPWGHVTTSYRDGTSLLNTDSVIQGASRSRMTRDAAGRATRSWGPAGDSSRTVYDVLNRALRRVGPLGDSVVYTYGDSLFLTQVRDPLGQVTTFLKNAVGLDTAVTDPNSKTAHYGYDRGGRVVRWVNRRNLTTSYSYNASGQLLGRGLADQRVTSFAYGQTITEADNGEGSDTLRFAGDTSFAIAVRGGVAHTVRVRRYGAQRYRYVAVWRAGGTTYETLYEHDSTGALGLILPPSASADSIVRSSDFLTSRIRLYTAENLTFAYRPRHDLAQLTHSASGLQTAFGMEFVHDSLGRVVEARDSNRNRFERYSFDQLGRLGSFTRYATSSACTATDTTSETGALCTTGSSTIASASYSYDLAGNFSGSGDTVTTGSRQVAHAGYHLEYDDDGNVIHRQWTENGNPKEQRFYWSSANELDSVITTGGSLVTFGYDGFGRRVRKTVDGTTTYYIWDGGQVVAEYTASGALLHHYTYYQGADRPHSDFDGTSRHYFVTDGRANVSGLMSGPGSEEANYRYTPFGGALGTTGSVSNAIRFAGRELDTETGLYYMRARYYDPQVGRFVSQDPAGAGAANAYSFANDDPINGWDPSGGHCEFRKVEIPKAAIRAGGIDGANLGGGPEYGWQFYCDDSYPGYLDFGNASWGFGSAFGATGSAPSGDMQSTAQTGHYCGDGKPTGSPLFGDLIVTSGFRAIRTIGTSPHIGVDLHAPDGTPVRAMGGGVVTYSDVGESGLESVWIRHDAGWVTNYLHLSQRLVSGGALVTQGQVIGYSGHSGGVAPHLHVGMLHNGVRVDPIGPCIP